MGVFDYLSCKYPLPVEGLECYVFQTKDTPAQWLDNYEIREDGTLWHLNYDTEDHSDPNAEGLYRLQGMATPVNERWEPVDFTGEILFYTDTLYFSAYFIDGKIKHLVNISTKKRGV